MADPLTHHLVQRPGAVHDVVVDDQSLQAAALHRERAVAVLLDEVLEDPLTQSRQRLQAVRRLPQPEHTWAHGPCLQKRVDRWPDIFGNRHPGFLNQHALYRIVELPMKPFLGERTKTAGEPSTP
nr:hypothetical protein [Kibdelosporangium sp. MJ126-NF4]CTQ94820.1 hypothetical protein [Kibdelosporangium sp. MJ126-NF4]